jgi:hypothetical protein
MDETVVLLAVTFLSFVGVMYGIHSFNAVRIREIDRKIAQAKRMSQVRAGGRSSSLDEDRNGHSLPGWAEDLINEYGLEDYLDSDEMPPELKRLLPLAKGFLSRMGSKEGSEAQTEGEAWH